jgi:hypothetical protein
MMAVPELKKPRDVACAYVGPTGCSIYADRPPSCANWSCAWILKPDIVPVEMRPDLCGYLFDLGLGGIVAVLRELRPGYLDDAAIAVLRKLAPVVEMERRAP